MLEDTRDRLERQRERAVRRAERQDGFKEGLRVWGGEIWRVEVTFYPSRVWWISHGSNRQELTRQIWDETTEFLT